MTGRLTVTLKDVSVERAAAYGERFEPPKVLAEMAQAGKIFLPADPCALSLGQGAFSCGGNARAAGICAGRSGLFSEEH